MLIGLTQQPAQKPNLPHLLDTSQSILVSSKQQEGNQYGSGGADYICRLSETVQDRGAVPGVFIPAAVSEWVCVPLLQCEGVLPHLPPEPVPVQEVP